MQTVVFGQKLKKGFLIALLSFVLVLPIVGSLGVPEVAVAQGTNANQFVPANAPANTPPATPTPPAADQSGEAGTFEKAVAFIAQGPKAVVNLLILTFIQILLKFMELLAFLFSFVIEALKVILTYRGYASQGEISVAWAIVRDTINSFFIVVLIAIAISTIIRFQTFNFRSTLPRLILATLLVNFSKTICLLAISFADAVMSTFATQLIAILPSYALGLRLPALASFNPDSIGGLYGAALDIGQAAQADSSQMLSLLVSAVLGLVMMIFALGGLVMFMIILLFRIIVLWFLIILSPLAFFLWGVPGRASSYWGQWLEEFIKHIIVGPIGAFFLYIIAFFYVQNIQSTYGLAIGANNLPKGGLTLAASPNVLIGYLVSLGMMLIALEIVEKLGVRGGQFAREIGVDKIAKGITGTMARGLQTAVTGGAGIAGDLFTKRYGIPLSPSRAWEGIAGGLTKKREQLAKDAMIKTSKIAEGLAERGSALTPLYAYATGNQDMIASMGIRDMLKFGKGIIPGTKEFKDLDGLKGQYGSNQELQNAASKYGSMNTDLKTAVGGMTKAQLSASLARVGAHNDYKKANSSIAGLEAQFNTAMASGDYAAQTRIAQQLNAARRTVADYEAGTSAEERAKMETVAANEGDLRKFDEALGKDAVAKKMGENGTIEAFSKDASFDVGKDGQTNVGRDQKKIVDELKRRQKFASLAVSGARSDLTAKMKDYSKDTYEREVKYGTDDIYANMLLNRDPKKRENFAADLVKAAEMGKFDDVLHKFMDEDGKPYEASPAGVKKFVDTVLQKELGFNKQEALTIVAEAQGRNMAGKKISQLYVKMDGVTKDFEFMTDPDQEKAVASKIKDMGAFEALRTLKTDGLGYKDSSGKFVANKGAIDAIKASGLKNLMKNENQFNQIDANTKTDFLIANADKLDLSPEEVQKIRDSLK